jgi:transcriptional regulator with XRE-family HTH domain
MTKVKRSQRHAPETAATKARSFRTFLLMAQLEAKEIGGRIALARQLAALTQDQLAALAPFSKRSLQEYEAGNVIPYKHFRELSRLLNRPEEWFLYGRVAEDLEARIAALERRLEDLPSEEDVRRGFESVKEAIDALATRRTREGGEAAAGQ